jgi:hypothetical protein
MGLHKENYVLDESLKQTAFDDFIVNFIVAFSGSILLILSNVL